MDFQKTDRFATEIRPCSSCSFCKGASKVQGEILCKNDLVASDRDATLGTSDFSCEFIKNGNISITQPSDFGLDCEFRKTKQDRNKRKKERNDIPSFAEFSDEED